MRTKPARSMGELEREVTCKLESARIVPCGTDSAERRGSPDSVWIAEDGVIQGVKGVGLDDQLHILPRQPEGTLDGGIDVP